jgi:glycosyltransferase involved in cell wall biosynthesis
MNILFVAPYPVGEAPSQRFRFEQYLNELTQKGHSYKVSPFLNLKTWNVLYKKGYFFQKFFGLINGYFRRFIDILNIHKYDVIFIHREAVPFGPPVFGWMATRVFKKYTVYDFDDAIWLPNASKSNKMTLYFRRFKNASRLCQWASKISVGNRFLAEYAAMFNSNVVINPTTIDTEEYHNSTASHDNHHFTIGWTGSHSTIEYLEDLYPVFVELEKKFDYELHVICDVPPSFNLKSLKFIKWTKQSEVDDLMKFNVGIMPLPDNVWTRSKCGFKALQYMALGIPAVVSDVGVNSEIVDHDVNGCLCRSTDDWYLYLSKLMSDKNYLLRLSANTREKIISKYSVQSNKENFLKLFNKN